jgi:hypothetical protein
MKPTSALFTFGDDDTSVWFAYVKGKVLEARVTIGGRTTVFPNSGRDFAACVTDAKRLVVRAKQPKPEPVEVKPMRRRTNGSPRSARRTKRVPGLKVVR